MFVVLLALLHAVASLDIQIVGDVAFDVRVAGRKKDKQKWFRQEWEAGKKEKEELVLRMLQVQQNVTAAPEMECIYQYPEREQVDAVLSNMMNELTKVFVRADDFINGVEARRGPTSLSTKRPERRAYSKPEKPGAKPEVQMNKKLDTMSIREDSRFKVVKKKHKAFFELIYSNMTNDYRHFYNTTAERVDRSGRDPCQHQDEVKQIWRDLLEHSLATLKTAAHRCVDEYLADQRVDAKSKVRVRLNQYLSKELSKVRAGQLDMLCDTYQLCYNELLK